MEGYKRDWADHCQAVRSQLDQVKEKRGTLGSMEVRLRLLIFRTDTRIVRDFGHGCFPTTD